MKKITYFMNILIGLLVGFVFSYISLKVLLWLNIYNVYATFGNIGIVCVYMISCVIFSVIFLLLSNKTSSQLKRFGKFLESLFTNIPTIDLVFGALGLTLGLIIASLISSLYSGFPWNWVRLILSSVTYLILGYLGITICTKRRNDIINTLSLKKFEKTDKKDKKFSNAKILDTSVIIDGRILDIMRSGFMEGNIIVSDLVLNELRHIADFSDHTKRIRGRRGLDIIKTMQEEFDKNVIVYSTAGKYKDIEEVDEKLVCLTKDLKGKIVTNDFNLNKMAQVHKVDVLNINELAKVLKPNVISGEKMQVEVIKQGKDEGQGIAYLDDGTMIVVENGSEYIGKSITAEITSVIQTTSGRMIFAIAI